MSDASTSNPYADYARLTWYNTADQQMGWAAGTAAANNGEPWLTQANWDWRAAGNQGNAPGQPGNPAWNAAGTPDPSTGDVTGASATQLGVPGVNGGLPVADSNQMSTTKPGPDSSQMSTTPPPVTGGADPNNAASPNLGMYQSMVDYLQQYGLSSLFSIGPNGAPSGWLWDQMVAGVDTADEIKIAIENTNVWKSRFDVIVKQREAAASGQPIQVMTPDQVIQYETTAAATFRNAGLPTSMYSNPQRDFEGLMLGNVSTAELQDRLGEAFSRVKDTPPAVRAAFQEFYGVGSGDAGLAAFFLDPDTTMANLQRDSRVAFTAGTGARYGINVDFGLASSIADKGLTDAGVEQGFENVNRLDSLFQENATDQTDLSAEKEGVASVFGGDGLAQQKINQRAAERSNQNRANSGGALVTNAGAIGAGRIDQ